MTDETGKNDVTKPAAEAAPKPSRRQVAILGAAAPVLLTLPIRGARAGGDYDDESGDRSCGACNASTFSADPEYQDKTLVTYKTKRTGTYRVTTSYHYSCIGDDVIEHKNVISSVKVS